MSARRTAWPSCVANGSPRARRLATEKGSATPTMNMNDGLDQVPRDDAGPGDVIEPEGEPPRDATVRELPGDAPGSA